MPLVTLARTLGFRTIVIDGRPRFATRERFPDVDDLRIGIPSELVRELPLIATTALVLVAHDYKYDLPVLRHALGTPVGYIGMLGLQPAGRGHPQAAARGRRGRGRARRACACPSASTWAPQSAPEIALAILAEILAVQRGATGLPISEKVRRGRK